MSVKVMTSETQFEALRAPWGELFASSPNHTPFQSWEWNFTWWKHFGKAGALHLLVVEQDGQLIGIAPLFLRPRYHGWPLRHLAFIASKRSDYLDFIVRGGMEAVFFHELFAHLREHASGWGFLELRDFPETSANLPHLLRESLGAFTVVGVEAAEMCVTVPLPETYDDYLATLGKNSRRNALRYRKQLEKDFAVRWHTPTEPTDIHRCFDDFVALYRSRWEQEHGATFFDEAAAAAFEREICQLGSEAGWYRLYLLYVDDRPAAGYCGYACNDKYYAGLFAHSPELREHNVGTVMVAMTIEHCIANGWNEFDLTRGEEAYKYQWHGRNKRNYRIGLYRSRTLLVRASLAGWLYQRTVKVGWLRRLRAMYRQRRLKVSAAH
jgi:CelD/BcsL family acetyltransferase involved in cellulose biosynthesis